MSKLSLDRLTSSFGFQAAFNSVLESIEQEFSEKVLYRDNPMGTNNVMKNDIDMGEHDILNVGKVAASDFTINGVEITQSLEEALAEVAAYPAEAKGYRDEAEGFRNDAEGFASSAALSEHNAALSASQAFAWKEDAEAAATSAAADAAAGVVSTLSAYVDDAEDARDAAVVAQGLAEDAKDDVLAVLIDYVTKTGVETLTNKTLTGYTETVYGLSGTTPAIDPDNGSIQTWALSANSTPTDSLSAGQSMTLMIKDGTSFSITWPTMTWVGGSAPTLATSGFTVVVLWKVGSTLYGMKSGEVD